MSDRVREVVALSEFYDWVMPDLAFIGGIYKNGEAIYEEVDEEVTYTDIEEGYQDITKVYLRVFDERYFKWSYSYSPHVGLIESACSENLIEVFPREVLVTIYE